MALVKQNSMSSGTGVAGRAGEGSYHSQPRPPEHIHRHTVTLVPVEAVAAVTLPCVCQHGEDAAVGVPGLALPSTAHRPGCVL